MKARLLVMTMMLTTGCITTQREKEMRNEIFNLQTRLMELERNNREKGDALTNSSEAANQRIASTSSTLDKISRDLAKLNGEIDALKVGVATGKLPGTDPAEESVATQLLDMQQRLGSIEEKQKELETALESKSAPVKSNNKGGAKEESESGNNSKSLRAAFRAKNYQQVVDIGSDVIGKTKEKKVKLEMIYYVAESFFKIGKLRESALKYNEFVDGGGSGEQLPFAKMRLGDCFRGLGDNSTAKLYYEDVLKNHSKAPEAEKSRQRLAEISGKS